MQFETGHIYHIYNQGNNRRKIFFNRDNQLYFLKKIRKHIVPFADILAWCLMPNHFHLMVYVNHIEVDEELIIQGKNPDATPDCTRNKISFNKSIGILLASYTRAINKRQNWSGSLFRSETKAVCLTEPTEISSVWQAEMGITQFTPDDPELNYPNTCFNYILYNPVKDRFVSNPEDWEFSSFTDTVGNRNGSLINKKRIREFGLCIY